VALHGGASCHIAEMSGMNSINITRRNKKIKSNITLSNSFEGLTTPDEDIINSLISTTPTTPKLNRSCTEKEANNTDRIGDLERKILILEEKLQTTDYEIENLLVKNKTLSDRIQNYELRIKKLTSVCKSTPLKKPSRNKTKSLNKSPLDFPCSPSVVETSMQTANDGSDNIVKHDCTINHMNTNSRKKRKLRILSISKQHNLIKIIEKLEIDKHFDYCHHLRTNTGIMELFDYDGNNLSNLDKKDCCIILIGESGFYATKDYNRLIFKIRNFAQQLQHTNIIIAVPTYICGAIIFNCRVEIFNRLLSLDVHNNKYAHLIDSNFMLSFDMFSPQIGKLNKKGMICILQEIIKELPCRNKMMINKDQNLTTSNEVVETDNDLFHT
jgi:FtsZ-binding cell division protein ZapB